MIGLLPLFACPPFAAAADSRPNVVLILADDLGVECVGAYGGQSYATPAIDRLASEGIRFTHAYSQPLCTNTRIQLMTGIYNHRNWLAFGLLDPKVRTFGHDMQTAGYRTCIAGKWQLQSYDPPDYPGAETRRGKGMRVENAGFDAYSLWHVEHTEDKGSRYAKPRIYENGRYRDETDGEYGPDVWVNFINRFITEHQQQHADQPFFVYYSMALPHWPMVPTPRSDDWNDTEKRNLEDTRHFAEMVEYMDICVDRIVRHVDKEGLGNETLILFFSDNGTHRDIQSRTADGIIQGGKGLTTDAGTRVPLIARWSGTIRPRTDSELVDSTDILPTLLAAAKRPIATERNIDGISFYSRLMGGDQPTRDWVYCFYDPRPGWDKDQFERLVFARNKRFKLYEDGNLFDIRRDPNEQVPVRDTESSLQSEARDVLQEVLDQQRKRIDHRIQTKS